MADARNDVFHAIALTGGAFRFAEPGQISRTYFAIAELETVRDDLRVAGELADDILGRARLPLPPYSAEQREYYRAIGRVIYEYHWLFTCLVDVLRNLGDHHERDLRLREMQYLLNHLEEVIEQRSGDKSEELLRELSRRTRTANSQRNRVVHAVPDDGNPFKLAATTPQQSFDVGNQQALDQLGTELLKLWHLADRIVKAQESPLPSYMQGIPLRRIDL
ncbi:MAG: hypothetical protein EOP90_15720 [Lysobacteraceae bacterium]|nr:MAG: hypothetical protein EOP90_15720 [Xanthomonadaceae bacterium]